MKNTRLSVIISLVLLVVLGYAIYFRLDIYMFDRYAWHIYMSDQYHAIHDYARELKHLKNAIRIDNITPDAHANLVRYFVDRRDIRRMEDHLPYFEYEDKYRFVYLAYRGLISLEKGNLSDTAEKLELAMKTELKEQKMKPFDFLVSSSRLGMVHLRMNKSDKAIRAFDACIEFSEKTNRKEDAVKKRHAMCLVGRGIAYEELGMKDMAEKDFLKANTVKAGVVSVAELKSRGIRV